MDPPAIASGKEPSPTSRTPKRASVAKPNQRIAMGVSYAHSFYKRYCVHMATVSNEVSTRELRNQLSDVLSRAMYAGERIGVTRNGKLAAVVVSVADLEALEAFEMAQDVAAYREAKAEDDGKRISLAELRAELALASVVEVPHSSISFAISG